jgi:hypothetical protein
MTAGNVPGSSPNSLPNAANGEAVPMLHHEFDIEGVRYRYEGPALRGYAFTSVDPEGVDRLFFAYQSNSEGGWRVSQGVYVHINHQVAPYRRYIKGPEVYEDSHYTQDTQPHPLFEQELWEIVVNDFRPGHPDLASRYDELYQHLSRLMEHDEHSLDRARRDFHDQITRVPLGSLALQELLSGMPTGNWHPEALAASLGMPLEDTGALWQAYEAQIQILNSQLQAEDVIPDFGAQPADARRFEHPVLGACYTEIFTHTQGDCTYEWHMSRDLHGRVWIDRIRLADSPPTPYGTDAHIVASGVLTSKPIEYTRFTLGIPEAQRPEIPESGYSDITAVLNRLEPIQRYRQHYPSRMDRFERRPRD